MEGYLRRMALTMRTPAIANIPPAAPIVVGVSPSQVNPISVAVGGTP
jgi:hypothetical protein